MLLSFCVPISRFPFFSSHLRDNFLLFFFFFSLHRLQILEWNGVSLVDRSFEEVCAVMDRTGDSVDLLVEHAADIRMCDLLDETGQGGSGSGGRKSSEDQTASGLAPGKKQNEKKL